MSPESVQCSVKIRVCINPTKNCDKEKKNGVQQTDAILRQTDVCSQKGKFNLQNCELKKRKSNLQKNVHTETGEMKTRYVLENVAFASKYFDLGALMQGSAGDSSIQFRSRKHI